MATRAQFNTDAALERVFQDSDSENDTDSSSDSELDNDGGSQGSLDDNSDREFQPDEQMQGRRQRHEGRPVEYARRQVQRRGRCNNDGEIPWMFYNVNDNYTPDWLPAYNRRRGILVDTADFEPVDYFQLFFPDDAFDLIAEETNLYAMQFFDDPTIDELPFRSRFRQWSDTSADEIKAFVALQILMGLCQKPVLSEYWGTYPYTHTKFGKIMRRDRFLLLQSFLHFNNNNNQVVRGAVGYNPLFKIQRMLDIVDPLYEAAYSPERELSIDESMIKYKGRLSFKQYMPAKPTKFGVKQFVLSESQSGYGLKFMIYTGKSSFNRLPGVGLGEQVVLQLLQGYENIGHTVYMDNYYSSPKLFHQLQNIGIGACGTVRGNRRHMPVDIQPRYMHMRRGDAPIFLRSDNLVTCAWHDTKQVTFLSTFHTNDVIEKRIRSRHHIDGYRQIQKPLLAEDYNKHMGGVDLLDQMLGTYSYPHKSIKWYHPIYHRIREVALVNGYIIYQKASDENKLSPIRFRQEVVNGLLQEYTLPTIRQGHPSFLPNPARLTERHFIAKYTRANHRPDCIVCSDRRQNIRHQTTLYCQQCEVPLHIECFKRFHTLRDFRNVQN